MSTASRHWKILSWAQSEIQDIALSGIDFNSVVIRRIPTDREGDLPNLPGVLIAAVSREAIPDASGTNESDDIEYPFVVATVAAKENDNRKNLQRNLDWREEIIDKLIHRRISTVSEVLDVLVRPGEIVDVGAWFGPQIDVSILFFVARARVNRRS